MSDEMTVVQFLRASGEHWDDDRYTEAVDRIEMLEALLRFIRDNNIIILSDVERQKINDALAQDTK